MAYPPSLPNYQGMQKSIPSAKVELSISCRDLLNLDGTSKSDPLCALFTCEFGKDRMFEVGRTEVIKDTVNPDFVQKFVVEYRFEELQKLRFAVYDSDSSSHDLSKHDFLGEYETSLGEIVSLKSITQPLRAKGSTRNLGKIIIRSEEVLTCNDIINLQLSGQKLDKKDVIGKSDPYLVFYKANEDQSFTAVHKTEVIKNSLNPVWREFYIPLSKLCNGDVERSLKVECYDWDSDGEYGHDLIGAFLVNVRLLTAGSTFDLIHPEKKLKKKNYKNSGSIRVETVRMTKDYTFLDYIQAGVQMNFTVAIDFTQSNRDPQSPESLHYIDGNVPNQYATAILSVGSIIQDYDSDKMFPALGFGGKLPNGIVSHEFFLNGHPTNPFCAGIGGIMQAYQTAIRTVELWGPTNFSPVINHVARFASAVKDGSNYYVLLIITDGAITDMTQTVQAIVSASSLPMSIIIVGVGGADFSAMRILDDEIKTAEKLGFDGHSGSHSSGLAERDIVQFVAMRDFLSQGDSFMVQARLAKEVLAEIPGQFVSYMRKRGIKPPQQRMALPQ